MPNETELMRIFRALKTKLENKRAWQNGKYELYSGKAIAPRLPYSITAVDKNNQTKLDWCRTAVDHLVNKFKFDVIKNDLWGANALLEQGNFDAALRSALRSSVIGACGYISTLRGENKFGEPEIWYTPYTGKEATGEYDSLRNTLRSGLAIIGYSASGMASDYRLFLPDGVYDIRRNGEEIIQIQEGIGVVQLELVAFRQDAADRPFGESRITEAAANALYKAQRTYNRIEEISEAYAVPQRVLLLGTDSNEDDSSYSGPTKEIQERKSKFERVLKVEGNYSRMEAAEWSANDPRNLILVAEAEANKFASSMLMMPSDFGFEPSNGSMSSDSIRERKSSLNELVEENKPSYSRAILNVAKTSLLLRDGAMDSRTADMTVRWLRNVHINEFVGLGDSLSKIKELTPEDKGEEFVYDFLGISMRGEENRSAYASRGGRRVREIQKDMISRSEAIESLEKHENDPKNRRNE